MAIAIVFSLLTPTAVKFSHPFTHHKLQVCLSGQTTHFHNLGIGCDFYKFKLSKSLTFTFFNIEIFSAKEEPFEIISEYGFFNKYERLKVSLRGPPSSI